MAEPNLFSRVADCPATLEAVEQYGLAGLCPLCHWPADRHDPEDADVVRLVNADDFDAWMMSLPRSQA